MTPFSQLEKFANDDSAGRQVVKEALAKAIGAGVKGIGRFAKDLVNPAVTGMRASNRGVYKRIAGDLASAARGGNMNNGYYSVGGQFSKLKKNLTADAKSLWAQLRGEMKPGGIHTIGMKAPATIPLKASPEQLAATTARLAENPGVGYMGVPLTTAKPPRLSPSDPYQYLPQTRRLHSAAIGTPRGSSERNALAAGIKQHRASRPGMLTDL